MLKTFIYLFFPLMFLVLSSAAAFSSPHPLTGMEKNEALLIKIEEIKNGCCSDWCGDAEFYLNFGINYLVRPWIEKSYNLRETKVITSSKTYTMSVGEIYQFADDKEDDHQWVLTYNQIHQKLFVNYTQEQNSILELSISLKESDSLLDYLNISQGLDSLTLARDNLELKDLISKIRNSQNNVVYKKLLDNHQKEIPSVIPFYPPTILAPTYSYALLSIRIINI